MNRDRRRTTARGRALFATDHKSAAREVKDGQRRYDQLVAEGIIRSAADDGDPLEDSPDIRLRHGTAAALIDADRGD